ncbi:MAG: nuclear transport factor 2 family protein [Gammaproteobacteria bacterium]|jgi:hypothetical protein|uniref:Nuclear transport factor 2 family protein n=1 Tax=SAR86 cluster bacterium TaxID=2030880 RepID=A0A368C4I8_9GAMM|nr:MAG: nuclear transport factor 2 family protein [SAR86 cluster bacterium]|tara:strand:+ start:106 stop:534 length:429 start_codon:yes stop_codon:yes gene_type:complete
MIEEHIKQWHDFTHGNFPGGLDTLLADDIIFYSPVVFTPQEGKELAKLYLMAAGNTFGGDDAKKNGDIEDSSFRYTKEVLSGNQAILEFETKIEGKYVNGVDIISFNEDGKISEFKVMIRPLQAVNIIHMQMQKMLAELSNA